VWQTETAKKHFNMLIETVHNHTLYVNRSQIWDRIVSKSYIAVLDDNAREAIRVRVNEVVQHELGDVQDHIPYPQITTIAIAIRK
jgi:hypothetical protein